MRYTPGRYHALITTEGQHPSEVRALLRFRKRLFVDCCGWSLETSEDIERDEFDRHDTEHCLLWRDDRLIGGFRASRCDRPFLTSKLARGLEILRPLPRRPDVWDISRFGVDPSENGRVTARLNYALMFYFAQRRGATALTALADLPYERFLQRLGIQTSRFGPPQSIGADRRGRDLTVVAGEIPLGQQNKLAIKKFLELAALMDIHDEAHVFGRSEVSTRSARLSA